MSKILILENSGNIYEKTISLEKILNIEELNLNDYVKYIGEGKLEKIIKCNYYDNYIVFYGWSKGNDIIKNNSKINIPYNKDINFYGDIICLLLDNNNNIIYLDKDIYNNNIKMFFEKLVSETKINNDSDDENNIIDDISYNFNLSYYIKEDFI